MSSSRAIIAAAGTTVLAALACTCTAAAQRREFPVAREHRGVLVFRLTALEPREIKSAYLKLKRHRRALAVWRVRAAARRGRLRIRAPRVAHLKSRRARRRQARKWKLVVVTRATVAPGSLPGGDPGSGVPTPSGVRSYRWILTGSNMASIREADPALADHFFNTPLAYANGNPLAQQNQTPLGYRAIPTLRYASYAAFAADVGQGRIDSAIRAVYYDPEHWSETPESEQRDPYTYLRMFAQLGHAHGYVVITSPGRNLMGVPGAPCVARSGETYDEAYVRCDVAGAAARYADVSKIQAQARETEVAAYRGLVSTTARQARAANPSVVFLSNLSTSVTVVTPDQLFDAARSVDGIVDGHYLTIQSSDAGQLNTAVQFFRKMQAAGF